MTPPDRPAQRLHWSAPCPCCAAGPLTVSLAETEMKVRPRPFVAAHACPCCGTAEAELCSRLQVSGELQGFLALRTDADFVEHYQAAVRNCERSLGEDHPLNAALLLELGKRCVHAGDLERALPTLERVVALLQRQGLDDPALAQAVGYLAKTRQQRGEREEAE